MSHPDIIFHILYGSRLYGTQTPTSDYDYKAIYLPAIDDMLLGKKLVTFKERVGPNGEAIGISDPMPDGGAETEYIPLQTFVADFVRGQTYAIEVAFGLLAGGPSAPDEVSKFEYSMLEELVEKFSNSNVSGMIGFAVKQTFDYVHRGERLEKARKLYDAIAEIETLSKAGKFDNVLPGKLVRLDTVLDGKKVIDTLSEITGLEKGTTVNNNRTMETLKLNGRNYLETTTLSHLLLAVGQLVASYGQRSAAAAAAAADTKSMSHAVRVYQQAIELLQTGFMVFPRPNAEELIELKTGQMHPERMRELLLQLEVEVAEAEANTSLPKFSEELIAESQVWLMNKLRVLYLLD